MLLNRARPETIHFVLFVAAFAALLWSGGASAQGLGRISGTVTDTTGANVSGAQINGNKYRHTPNHHNHQRQLRPL